jgi:hypothetical protein
MTFRYRSFSFNSGEVGSIWGTPKNMTPRQSSSLKSIPSVNLARQTQKIAAPNLVLAALL